MSTNLKLATIDDLLILKSGHAFFTYYYPTTLLPLMEEFYGLGYAKPYITNN